MTKRSELFKYRIFQTFDTNFPLQCQFPKHGFAESESRVYRHDLWHLVPKRSPSDPWKGRTKTPSHSAGEKAATPRPGIKGDW